MTTAWSGRVSSEYIVSVRWCLAPWPWFTTSTCEVFESDGSGPGPLGVVGVDRPVPSSGVGEAGEAGTRTVDCPPVARAPGIGSVRIDSRLLPQPIRTASGCSRIAGTRVEPRDPVSPSRRFMDEVGSPPPCQSNDSGSVPVGGGPAGLCEVDDGSEVGDLGPSGCEDGVGIGVDLRV